jgi:ornithine carbamoyltransferase
LTRHFLRDDDLTSAEQDAVLDLADRMKKGRFGWQPLVGPRAVAVLFDKPSLRTRVSFTVGIAELGGHPLVIDTQTTHIGRGETIEDVARVLARQVAAIAWRTAGQERIEAMASVSTVPVINALTDQFHPCQILADLQTIRAHYGSLASRVLTFLGDGSSNMAHSYLLGGATAGMRVRIGAPDTYHPDPAVLAAAARIAAETGGSVDVLTDARTACQGADVIATDVWTSMGQDSERTQRLVILGSGDSYRLDSAKLALGRPGCLVLHCLPAHRGEEITADVIDGPNSVVWEQAENRLHAQKALLAWLCTSGGDDPPEPSRPFGGVEQP